MHAVGPAAAAIGAGPRDKQRILRNFPRNGRPAQRLHCDHIGAQFALSPKLTGLTSPRSSRNRELDLRSIPTPAGPRFLSRSLTHSISRLRRRGRFKALFYKSGNRRLWNPGHLQRRRDTLQPTGRRPHFPIERLINSLKLLIVRHYGMALALCRATITRVRCATIKQGGRRSRPTVEYSLVGPHASGGAEQPKP